MFIMHSVFLQEIWGPPFSLVSWVGCFVLRMCWGNQTSLNSLNNRLIDTCHSAQSNPIFDRFIATFFSTLAHNGWKVERGVIMSLCLIPGLISKLSEIFIPNFQFTLQMVSIVYWMSALKWWIFLHTYNSRKP